MRGLLSGMLIRELDCGETGDLAPLPTTTRPPPRRVFPPPPSPSLPLPSPFVLDDGLFAQEGHNQGGGEAE